MTSQQRRADHLLCLTSDVGIISNSPASVLPFAAILSPGLLPGSHLPVRHSAPVACVRCDAYACSYSRVRPGTGEWSCTFCGAENAPSAAVQDLESAVDWVEGGAPSTVAGTPGSPAAPFSDLSVHDPTAATFPGLGGAVNSSSSGGGGGGGGGSDPVRIIAIDLASAPDVFDRLKDAVFHAIDATPDSARVALIAFGAAAAVCRLPPSADVLSPRSGAVRAAHFDTFIPQNGGIAGTGAGHRHVAPLGECRDLLRAAVGALRPQTATAGLQRVSPVIDAAISLARSSDKALLQSRPDQQAMERPASSVAAHLVLLTASAPLHDPQRRGGEPGLAEALAAAAGDHGLVVDVLTLAEGGGSLSTPLSSAASPPTTPMKSATNAAVLGALATLTGGRVLAHAAVGSALAANLQDALSRGVGGACTLEIRCSEGLAVASAGGPVEPLTAAGRVVPTDWNGEPPARLLGPRVWGYLANPPDMHQAVILTLECTRNAPSQRHLYIQAAVTWTSSDGARFVRVVTRRIDPPSASRDSTVQGVRWSAVAVAFAKQVAGEALRRGAAHSRMQAEVLRKGIGEAVREVAEVLGTPDESSAGWFSGPSRFFLPAGAAPLAAAAFHLQRAVLHRGALPDGDAREMFFSGLAAAPLEVAERMAAPALWVLLPPARAGSEGPFDFLAGPAIELQRVPATDLALLLSSAAVVDAGAVVYVWLGRAAQGVKRMEDAFMEHAQRAACSRSPQADVVVVRQGDAAAVAAQARVLALLAPLSMDRMRARQLPLLAGFSEEQIEAAAEEAVAVMAAGAGGAEQVADAMFVTMLQWLASQGVLMPRGKQ